jgi:hypothetical protein
LQNRAFHWICELFPASVTQKAQILRPGGWRAPTVGRVGLIAPVPVEQFGLGVA